MTKLRLIITCLVFPVLFIVAVECSYSQTNLPGLVSLWKMEENGTTSLSDQISGHDALCNVILENDVNGKVGNAQYFDFTNRATVPNHSDFNFAAHSSFSIVYWMKFTETQYGLNGGQDHIIISKGDWKGGGPPAALWASGVNGSGKVNFLLSDATGTKIDLEGDEHYNDGLWHHVACVRDETTNKSLLYADGIIIDESIYDYTGNFTNSSPIAFAHLINYDEPEYFYMGSVDEIAVYNRALSSKEINSLIGWPTILFEENDNRFFLFPNPVEHELYLRFNPIDEVKLAEIINSTGNIIVTKIILTHTETISIPLPNEESGIYTCRLTSQHSFCTIRFVVLN